MWPEMAQGDKQDLYLTEDLTNSSDKSNEAEGSLSDLLKVKWWTNDSTKQKTLTHARAF